MAQLKRATPEWQDGQAPSRNRSGPRAVSDDMQGLVAHPGPARALQERLSTVDLRASDEKWSPRQTLSFIGLTCGAFWLSVGAVVVALTR